MKKSVIAVLALSLMLFASVASANVIGFFGDMEATTCDAVMTLPYVAVTVHMVAMLSDITLMSACEFGATGLDLPNLLIPPSVVWNTDLAIGDIFGDGIALAFSPFAEAPMAYLGNITYLPLSPLPADLMMSIVPSAAGVLVVVDGEDASEHAAMGWSLIVNCSGDCGCDVIATDDNSWSGIKDLY